MNYRKLPVFTLNEVEGVPCRACVWVFWAISASSSEASLPRAAFPLTSLDRPEFPQAFPSSVEEHSGAPKTDPQRSLCDSGVEVALGPGIRHLTLVLAICNERGKGFFRIWKELRILNPTASSSKMVSSVLYSSCLCVGVASELAVWLLEVLPRTHYVSG